MKPPTGSITPITDPRTGEIRYRVRVTVNGIRAPLGVFALYEDAVAVRDAALGAGRVEGKGMSLVAWGARWFARRKREGLHRDIKGTKSVWDTHIATAEFAAGPMRAIKRTDVVAWVKGLFSKAPARASKADRERLGSKPPAVGSGGNGAGKTPARGSPPALARSTVLNAYRLLHRCLGDAADEGLIPSNPATGVKVPKRPRTTETWTWLRADEINTLLNSRLTPKQRAAFTLAIYTGVREGELWGLRWSDVERDEIVVRRSYNDPTKAGKVHRVPLLEPARAALRAWKKVAPGVGDALVFPAGATPRYPKHTGCHHKGYTAGLAKALRAAGVVRRVRFHDLRHTCASHLVQGTWLPPMRLEDVRQWGGWESIAMVERYAHLAPDAVLGLVRKARRNTVT